jgi:hypothetical protein
LASTLKAELSSTVSRAHPHSHAPAWLSFLLQPWARGILGSPDVFGSASII